MIQDDKTYYATRAAAERLQAERSLNPAVRSIHLCLAEEYGRRAAEPRALAPTG